MIPVTKPFLPPIDDYLHYVKGIWERQWLTNNGPLVNQLELKIKDYLDVKHMLYVANGTLALQLAIKALKLSGEIITTPLSYVATTSSIVWEGCIPVFADIDERSLNLDPEKIEAAITPQTSAILATHVYGNPCDIDAITAIAERRNLKVIYDASHCFGTKYNGKSVFDYGDVSTTSFHATKLFHTIEGGAIFTQSAELLKEIVFLRNFGHNGPEEFAGLGINAKNCEFHAAMGLVNLRYVDDVLAKRKELFNYYSEKLKGLKVARPHLNPRSECNFSYYPIVFETEELLLKSVEQLNLNWIYPRRYFYPSLSSLNYVKKGETPTADSISKRVLCLPMYQDFTLEEADFVSRILLRVQNN